MKIAFLWAGLSGYINSCLKELVSRDGVELFLAHSNGDLSAPYDDKQFGWVENRFSWTSLDELSHLDLAVENFAPHVVVLSGWHIHAYRSVAKKWTGRAVRIMAMDNCWNGTLKQKIGVISAPLMITPYADAVWLPGERQANFARKMGFPESRILRGLYSCDYDHFNAVHQNNLTQRPREFIFVGRYVEDKGIRVLRDAYKLYSERVSRPWPLRCYGRGPLEYLLTGVAGLEVYSFVQPDQLAAKFSIASCLLLPSRFENWGVVVHEAAAAGLAIVASGAVGSTPHLVQPGYNGYIVGPEDSLDLANTMERLTMFTDDQLSSMAAASSALASQFTPKRWADILLIYLHERLRAPC